MKVMECCYLCPDRNGPCHIDCKKYLFYSIVRRGISNKRIKEAQKDDFIWDVKENFSKRYARTQLRDKKR